MIWREDTLGMSVYSKEYTFPIFLNKIPFKNA
jgi:hypothetical protein